MNVGRTSRAGTLVVGASHAGIQLAARLRAIGDIEPIVVAGAEPHLPYQRPPLSKEALLGKTAGSDLDLRAAEYYIEQRLDLVLGDRVQFIERDSAGGTAHLASGREIGFSRLALAVGSRARRLGIEGAELANVLTLRSLDDLTALNAELASAHQVTVVGGGFLGLEIAAAARMLGKQVTVIEPAPRLMQRVVGPVTSSFLHDVHSAQGVNLLMGHAVTGIAAGRGGRANAVMLDNGSSLATDLVIVAIGATPRVDIAVAMGLQVDDGIVVDEACLASDRVTVAVGDCARCPHPGRPGAGTARFESINAALEQADVAAHTLVGLSASYHTPPWFWTNQYDVRVQIAGVASPSDQAVLRGDPREGSFSVLFYGQGGLTAAECINRPADFLVLRKLITQGESIPPERVGDLSVALKQLIAS